MKKIFSPLVFLVFASAAFSQKANDVFYVFKSDWSSAKDINEATYFMQVQRENDTTFVCRYYRKFGSMEKQETYSDADLTIPNGLFVWYNAAGKIDTIGEVIKGKKDGNWDYYTDSANVQARDVFENGKRIKTVNYKKGKEYYADGTVKDIEKEKETDSTQDKHVYVKAEYPGGEKGWMKYLVKNMQNPERFQQIAKNACTVIVLFSINKEGEPMDIQLGQSCEWSADSEAIKIVKNGGKWTPATIDGRKVIYRQKQSITFQVSQ